MGHTQLRENMTHNTCIERAEKRVHVTREEPMKRYFHHPFGMAYRINNEWVPCPGYGENTIIPQPPEDRERMPAAEWRPKKPEPAPIIAHKVPRPSREELERFVVKHGMSLAEIGRRKHCSATTVHNWFKQYKLETPYMRRQRIKEEQS